ncbi:MAG TPA: SDR family oxidoreductase [Gammaproteobacteria bacterium]|nr:SDR family oxidoreductase [Gammaproteobacteria bacterium]
MNIESRTIVITGALKGIGLAITNRMYVAGYNVCLLGKADKKSEGLHEVADSVNRLDSINDQGKVTVFPTDLRDAKSIDDSLKAIFEQFNSIDVIINNASVIALNNTDEITAEKFDLIFDINVRAAYLLSKFALPYLQKSSNPHILNIAPPINLDPKWLGSHVSYTASKYLMGMITVGLSTELKPYQIAVNALWPKTSIASTDICNVISGTYVDNMKMMRDPSIVADAAYTIVNKHFSDASGEQFIDEETLLDEGFEFPQDFDKYSVSKEEDAELLSSMYTD